MSATALPSASPGWTAPQKTAFRIASIFFVLLAFPLDWKFWRELATVHWSHFQDLFRLTIYTPHFISTPKWGLASYGNLWLGLAVAIVVGLGWNFFGGKGRTEYQKEYYWLRVLLRYRLAIGVIGYGVIKLFPLQFPQPTLSDLHTNYGDFLPWKIYYLTNGAAVAYYEQSLGLFEIIGGILLLGRRTAVIGAGLIAAILTNVVLANFAYELGDHVYSTYLLLIALTLLAHDAPRLFALLVREKTARADSYTPVFASVALRRVRVVLKAAFLLFVGVYGVGTYASFTHGHVQFPETPGLKGAAGYYNVHEFTLNGQTLPYSLTDPVRWQNVVLEPWNTLSIRINRPVRIELANPPIALHASEDRVYEIAGNGGRHFYSYAFDETEKTLRLHGKNDPKENLTLNYEYPSKGVIVLSGTDENGATLRVVLEKIDKKYLLHEGRRKPIKIN